MDSNLEIAFKEYLVNESGHHYTDQQLLTIFRQRHLVHDEIKNYVRINQNLWRKINYYYKIRCELVHKRATVGINDEDIVDFREIVEKVFKKLFKLKFDL